jgi:hypothetical protein
MDWGLFDKKAGDNKYLREEIVYSSTVSDGHYMCMNLGLLFSLNHAISHSGDRLCGLVVRVLDYRCRGPGFDSRALQKKK